MLAPSLTIYNKLVADFTPGTPKYVFRGIAEFATKAPTLVTGDNFEQRPQALDLFERDDVVVNVFNIAKFNVRTKDSRKIRRLSEFLGQSYFDYLAGLDDLVLIMDEAHRYRADTSMRSIEDLKPVLGLEVTATPQVEAGKRAGRFRNVIYDYPLSNAMRDGFVKEPAVATRADFTPAHIGAEALERIKLEDGVRVHEATKVDLEVYAQQNGVETVKPFMLVIAEDTTHANTLVTLIEDNQFFEGRYRGRVIQVHSGQKGAEKDDNVALLLGVERPDNPTEIVVHVNMLKEGWDVTNLYTIVPLRAANSRTLVEQSIGRGLRLPYGKRTGVSAVDRLTIVAHDRFQDIVDEAKKGGYTFNIVRMGEDIPDTPQKTVVAPPVFEQILGIDEASHDDDPTGRAVPLVEALPQPKFQTPEEIAAAKATLEAIRRITRDAKAVPGPEALQSAEVQQQLADEVATKLQVGQLPIDADLTPVELASVVRETTTAYVTKTIAIPRVTVVPSEDVRTGFHDFSLSLGSVRLPPVSRDILVQHLASDHRYIIGGQEGGHEEQRLEDYVVRGLIDFDDLSYDDHADLLYDLAGQVVAHLRSYLDDEDKVRNVLQYHQRQIASLVHTQMQQHAWEEASSYEAVVSNGFSEVRPQAFAAPANEVIRQFDKPITNRMDIRKMLFGGFRRCLYPLQKFDTDTERRFAVVLDKDKTVEKWFKPGKDVFSIRYTGDHNYEPDFVVETDTEKLICETKRAADVSDETVAAKSRAAATWCGHASKHEMQHGGKPWRYMLIPHDMVSENMTLSGLAQAYTVEGP